MTNPLKSRNPVKLRPMCLTLNPVTNHFNTINMEDLSLVAVCSPRLPRLGPQLQPLLPAKANKRKRLNAVLDKLANNIKVAPESPDDDGDNNLEFKINVKTTIKKESDLSSESEEWDNDDGADKGKVEELIEEGDSRRIGKMERSI